ncbi:MULTISPECIES: hypothetical protein [Asaia]|uniref:Uncharacterized protein n=1 Tax=Asaia spathodeae TaxID=657016 RepID=A0ABX2P935_9PROT|nr:hypothetical protein [Asaia spathodeae]GBR20515.1 hypothetical protein AA105894_2576 [Asaia spathodeae NBRC 105894]
MLKPRTRHNAEAITAVALGEAQTSQERPQPSASRGAEALQTARAVNPRLPPAQIEPEDKSVNHNMRVRRSTLRALGIAAEEKGMSVKQLIMTLVHEAGIKVAAADLENGKITPWRDR